MSTIFVTMTYSSGIPIMYLISCFSFFCTYWIDKFLLLKFYRLTEGYTGHVSRKIVRILPLSILLHSLFGLMIFSYPHIMNSTHQPFSGSGNQYFNASRMGQTHMLVFIAGCLIVWFILFFEKSLTHIASKIWKSCCSERNKKSQVRSRLRTMPAPAVHDTPGGPTPGQGQTPGEDDGGDYIYSDDIFNEYNFKQLYNELKKIRQEKQRMLIQKAKNRFTALQLKKYVDDYVAIIERNESAVYKRLR